MEEILEEVKMFEKFEKQIIDVKIDLKQLSKDIEDILKKVNQIERDIYHTTNPVSIKAFIEKIKAEEEDEIDNWSQELKPHFYHPFVSPVIYELNEEYFTEKEFHLKDRSDFEDYEEDLDFENFYVEDIDPNINSITIAAGGDWQGMFRFRAKLVDMIEGKFEFYGDVERVSVFEEIQEIDNEYIENLLKD